MQPPETGHINKYINIMTSERIKEIQLQTAYPESLSVQQALLKVWNECQQEKGNEAEDDDGFIYCPNCGRVKQQD